MDDKRCDKHVLVVDDERAILNMVKTLLIRMGCQVTTATGYRQALDTYKNGGPYDLAVLDETLPDGKGMELAGQLKTAQPDLKILLLSGFSAGIAGNEYPFLAKPFSPSELKEKVLNVIGQ